MGKNKVNNKKYAVKMIPKKDKYGNNSKAFVEEEKSILSSLDSEYVCRLIEFFEN
jgi:serine/threonine protein kinase